LLEFDSQANAELGGTMKHSVRVLSVFVFASCVSAVYTDWATADIPDPGMSTCNFIVTQGCNRTQCIDNFDPDVIRLTPDPGAFPAFDIVEVLLTVRDATGALCEGVQCGFREASGIVNLHNLGATSEVTDQNGQASISLVAGSGYGLVDVCADGVALCQLEVRSPDVNKGSLPSACVLPTSGMTAVNAADITNGTCGFLAKFGAVTPGVNNAWDLNCDGFVNGPDILSTKCGAYRFFGDVGSLGALQSCP
jgi:hypothetical protein